MTSATTLDTLLDKLAHDDQFRADLVANPVTTLNSLGIAANADQVPSECVLPSKEVIEANRAAIKTRMHGQYFMALFFLDGKANKNAA
jgi:putative modified peptide